MENKKTVITLEKKNIESIDLTALNHYVLKNNNAQYFLKSSGEEHYKLLAYLSRHIKSEKVVDIGTYYGMSAIALSFDETKTVVTYDIHDWIPDEDEISIKNKINIKYKIMDCLDDMETLLQVDFICLDIDPHDGVQEIEIVRQLEKYKYKGMLFLDDIHLNEGMRSFWESISHKKYDLTKFGHWSGSGLVIFDESKYDIDIVEE
jgi:predicted O-methyltransferase YrrM